MNRHGQYGLAMGDLWENEFIQPEPFFEGDGIRKQAWEFNVWTGNLASDNATKTITMNSNISMTANFSEVTTQQYTLTLTIDGNGTIKVDGNPYGEAISVDSDTDFIDGL